jgi:hypothetical protein
MTSIDIPLQAFTQSTEVNKLEIKILSQTLFESVILSATLKPIDYNVLPLQYIITISGDAYLRWGQDDNYVVQYVLDYLSIPKK